MAVAAIYVAYFVPSKELAGLTTFSMSQVRVHQLEAQSDPINRDALCLPAAGGWRLLDATIPTNSRVFILGALGPQGNTGRLNGYAFLSYYLFPREVAISLGAPAQYTLQGMTGRNPQSAEELERAGYDVVYEVTPQMALQLRRLPVLPARSRATLLRPLTGRDAFIALLLPLAAALAGRRLARLLFRDLTGVLSEGEWLACGLALGAFFLTQGILALRLAGLRLERALAVVILGWGAMELVLLILRLRKQPLRFQAPQLWWLLLAPALLMLWPLFRLAGLEGLMDFDGVVMWAFKAKLFHALAGRELWPWFHNPALAYAHLDYPLLVPLLHSFTYGTLGHVNEFVTKFWNQWMLLFLAWAVLGAGQFPRRRPC